MNAEPPTGLAGQPRRFSFDAAVRLLLLLRRRRRVNEAMVLRADASLAYPAADVLAAELDRPVPELKLGIPGLAGAGGPLPWHYSGLIRNGGARLRVLIDLLAQRMLGAFAEAGIKYRLDRAVETALLEPKAGPSQHEVALLAAAGFAGMDLDRLLPFGRNPILYYAGLFAQRPRTTAGLAALLRDWLGAPVEVVEFTGGWLAIEPGQQTRLPLGPRPGSFARLGHDAAIGRRTFDAQSRLTLRLGPLSWPAYCALLPGGIGWRDLVALARAYLGLTIGLSVQPVLAGESIPRLRLQARAVPGPLLGRTAWLDVPPAWRRRDGDEACFAETAT